MSALNMATTDPTDMSVITGSTGGASPDVVGVAAVPPSTSERQGFAPGFLTLADAAAGAALTKSASRMPDVVGVAAAPPSTTGRQGFAPGFLNLDNAAAGAAPTESALRMQVTTLTKSLQEAQEQKQVLTDANTQLKQNFEQFKTQAVESQDELLQACLDSEQKAENRALHWRRKFDIVHDDLIYMDYAIDHFFDGAPLHDLDKLYSVMRPKLVNDMDGLDPGATCHVCWIFQHAGYSLPTLEARYQRKKDEEARKQARKQALREKKKEAAKGTTSGPTILLPVAGPPAAPAP